MYSDGGGRGVVERPEQQHCVRRQHAHTHTHTHTRTHTHTLHHTTPPHRTTTPPLPSAVARTAARTSVVVVSGVDVSVDKRTMDGDVWWEGYAARWRICYKRA